MKKNDDEIKLSLEKRLALQEQEHKPVDDDIAAIIAAQKMLDAKPVPKGSFNVYAKGLSNAQKKILFGNK